MENKISEPNKIANEIIDKYFENKSYGFIKSVLNHIDMQLELICIVPTVSE